MPEKKRAVFDFARVGMALLVIANHTSPLSGISGTADFILTRIVARTAVPLFFMLTGYFVLGDTPNRKRLAAFSKKTAALYGMLILLYIPLNIYTGYFNEPRLLSTVLRDLFFSGTVYHLWYFPAVLLGVTIVFFLKRHLPKTVSIVICAALYLAGLFGDSYFGFIPESSWLSSAQQGLIDLFGYTRNGLFFAPLFLLLGSLFKNRKPLPLGLSIAGFAGTFSLMVAEGLALRNLGVQRHDSMYAALPFVMIFLFAILSRYNTGNRPMVRNVASAVYILHPYVIVAVRGVAKVTGTTALIVENTLVFYLLVAALSFAAVFLLSITIERLKPVHINAASRAWAEINLFNLAHNVRAIEAALPENVAFMAVVKANAYGHGDIATARHLNAIGVRHFAVATLEEGVRLRKHGVRGVVLILGHTDAAYARLLKRYRLTQTVCDFHHAAALERQKVGIDVHIKIDTGMHRLGIDSNDIDAIAHIYRMKHLRATGIFSHFSVADLLDEGAVERTRLQAVRFGQTIDGLSALGINPGMRHMQNSYGAANCPGLAFDLARIGILMYGVDSDGAADAAARLALRPTLALKTRVTSIRQARKDDCVGYGTEQIDSDKRLATLSIGYADGLPRCYAAPGAHVLIHGQPAPVVGRICMDQMIVDVGGIEGVEPGDTATIIGDDGGASVSCESVAAVCGTITNELLSRLGARLGRVYIK